MTTALRLGLASDEHQELTRLEDFERLVAIVGPLQARRSYDPGGIPASFAECAAGIDTALKVASCWSCKPDMGALGRGELDDQMVAFQTSVPAKHRLWMSDWHEPEDNIKAGQFTLADWTAGVQRAAALTTAFGRGRVRYGICLMDWTFDQRSGRNPEDYRAAAEAVDFVAVDAYGQSLDAFTAWGRSLANKPLLSVWESSKFVYDPQDLATYVKTLGDYCAAQGYHHLLGYNSDLNRSVAIIDGDPAAAAAFTGLVTQYGPSK